MQYANCSVLQACCFLCRQTTTIGQSICSAVDLNSREFSLFFIPGRLSKPRSRDTLKEYEISSQSPASNHCARIVLDAAGIAAVSSIRAPYC